MKTCRKCKTERPDAEFYSAKENKGGLNHKCKPCCRAARNQYVIGNPEKVNATNQKYRDSNREKLKLARGNYRLKYPQKNLEQSLRKYGMSPERYGELLSEQAGVCAICKREERLKERLAVDHNHNTGESRGLLCRLCNAALGAFDDSPEVCEAAAAYLRKFSEQSRAEVKQ